MQRVVAAQLSSLLVSSRLISAIPLPALNFLHLTFFLHNILSHVSSCCRRSHNLATAYDCRSPRHLTRIHMGNFHSARSAPHSPSDSGRIVNQDSANGTGTPTKTEDIVQRRRSALKLPFSKKGSSKIAANGEASSSGGEIFKSVNTKIYIYLILTSSY